jgi:hypothetical protein
MKYAMSSDDPFSLINHPLEPFMLKAHILIAPVLVLVFGMMLESHIRRRFSDAAPSQRRSGLLAVISFVPMALSGYALQVVSNPTAANVALATHLGASLVFCWVYGRHLVGYRRKARQKCRKPEQIRQVAA